MLRLLVSALVVAALLAVPGVASANHIPGQPCDGCASHTFWPDINGVIKKAFKKRARFRGTSRNDELLGRHRSDTLSGRGGSDVLWGDWDASGQPTSQRDRIFGGDGTDFIYASHGWNTIRAGAGNDAISAHFGRGIIDCGPGRDIYHVARKRKRAWTIRNCEKADYRPERSRGGRGLRPLG